jgi:hypothetical protein
MALPIVVLCFASIAHADGDKATAEALFSEGRRLMASGNYATACEKFAASQKLDPGLGTSLNLADCYEKSGRTASAWVEFRDAASAAHRVGSKDREQVARARADALEKQLSRLTLVEKTPHPEQRVARDGAPVDRAVLGMAVPVDPGQHVVDVVAVDRRSTRLRPTAPRRTRAPTPVTPTPSTRVMSACPTQLPISPSPTRRCPMLASTLRPMPASMRRSRIPATIVPPPSPSADASSTTGDIRFRASP